MTFLRKLFFNIWYIRNPPWDSGITPPEVLAYLEENSPGKALDLGCGSGTNSVTLAQHGWEVTGIDFAALAIRSARKKAKFAGVNIDFRTNDIAVIKDITDKHDLILDIGCLHSLERDQKTDYINQLPELLKPGGDYLVYAFLKSDDQDERPGLYPEDIVLIDSKLRLISRTEGLDKNMRNSAWFSYKAK